MPLKAVVDALDQVPEAYRSLYVERDGKFYLDTEGGEDVSGLKGALTKEREARAALEKKLKGFDGVDPERAKQLEEAAQKAEEEKQRAAGNFEELKKQLIERHGTELKAKDGDIKELTDSLFEVLAENSARSALDGKALSVDLILPHVLKNVRVVKDATTAKRVARVVDANGNERIADGNGTPMTIVGLVAEMATQPAFAPAFKGSGASGSGAPAGGGGGGRTTDGTKTIAANDNASFLANLDGIAKGTVKVGA